MIRLLFVLSIVFFIVGCASTQMPTETVENFQNFEIQEEIIIDTVNYDNEPHDAEKNLQIPESTYQHQMQITLEFQFHVITGLTFLKS